MPSLCGQQNFEILRLDWPMQIHMLIKRFSDFEAEGLGGAAYWVATLDLSTVQPEVYQRGSGRKPERHGWEAYKNDAIARWRKRKAGLGSADVTGSCVDEACRAAARGYAGIQKGPWPTQDFLGLPRKSEVDHQAIGEEAWAWTGLCSERAED